MLYQTRKNVFITTFEKRRKEKKGKERRGREKKGEEKRREECPIEAILNNHSVKLF